MPGFAPGSDNGAQNEAGSRLLQIAAEALDAAAGLFEVLGPRRIGNAKCRAEPEGCTLHHGHPLGLQELGDEILVARELLSDRKSVV